MPMYEKAYTQLIGQEMRVTKSNMANKLATNSRSRLPRRSRSVRLAHDKKQERGEAMFITDIPDAPRQDVPIVITRKELSSLTVRAAHATLAAAAPKTKYDAVFSMCAPMHSADQVPSNIQRDNLVSPTRAIDSYFESRGILLNLATGLGEPEPVLIKLLKGPAHGDLIARNKAGISFTYHANPDYLGSDQMAFEVEVLGKKFKVIQTVVIHNSGNLDYPTDAAKKTFDKVCPSDKSSSLGIIELPTEGFASDEELANLHSMISFAIGSGFMGNGNMLSFAVLAGGALGQATGSTITLDTNAAGNGWFIDSTPADNSEFLPTSDANIWQARAGSEAAGKIDMLSVLLHEYGHVLGIEHSADQHASMATTLTPGTRRMPSADEMALMSQLVGALASGQNDSPLPNAPMAPLGGGLAALLFGRLRASRFGGVSTVFDSAQLLPTTARVY